MFNFNEIKILASSSGSDALTGMVDQTFGIRNASRSAVTPQRDKTS